MPHPLLLLLLAVLFYPVDGLFPQQNERRRIDSLDGLWTFVREPTATAPPIIEESIGFINKWPSLDLSKQLSNSTVMPVPCAYNEIGVGGDDDGSELRAHVGWVWYQREHWLGPGTTGRVVLRFGSVNYLAYVFVNDHLLGKHVGGHLPFEVELEKEVMGVNGHLLITVAVNNWLSSSTIPPGDTSLESTSLSYFNYTISRPHFDFFHYAGILRPVQLLHLPCTYISQLRITADGDGRLSYRVGLSLAEGRQLTDHTVIVKVYMHGSPDRMVYEGSGFENETRLTNVNLWWPRGMGKSSLYTMEVMLVDGAEGLVDIYRETFGFRTVTTTPSGIYINGKRFYCLGFGMHEDFALIGRGFSHPLLVKDMNVLEWLGANCYRTSHYPYSEQRAYEADRRGFVVITEVPAVGMSEFTPGNRRLHARMVREMVARDYNHPSVIAWSLSNEPESAKEEALEYYSSLMRVTKAADATRPVTIVYSTQAKDEKTVGGGR